MKPNGRSHPYQWEEFPVLEKLGGIFHFIEIFISEFVSKRWKSWSGVFREESDVPPGKTEVKQGKFVRFYIPCEGFF